MSYPTGKAEYCDFAEDISTLGKDEPHPGLSSLTLILIFPDIPALDQVIGKCEIMGNFKWWSV